MPGPGAHRRRDHRLVFGEPYRLEHPYHCRLRVRCLTLEEDEITRCGEPVTAGKRCRVHQAQYRTMYLRYKDASRRAKELLKQTGSIPSKDEIDGCYCVDTILSDLEHVHEYRELVRIEKIGRDIHGRRFFLERDGPHRARVKFLEGEIRRASRAVQALTDRAKILRLAVSWWQRNSSRGVLNRSGNLIELDGTTSGNTTLHAYQGDTFRAPGLSFERTTGQPTGDAWAMDLDSDSDNDSDIVELDMCVIPKASVSKILTYELISCSHTSGNPEQ